MTYTFSTDLDGEDYLLIQGDTLTWRHVSYVAVSSTDVITTLDGNPVQNFTWANTGPYVGLSPALPTDPRNMTLDVLQARYALTILEYPTAADGYTLGLDFNDGPISGAATYAAKITYNTVPEPAVWALMSIGFGSLGAIARRRARRRRKTSALSLSQA